MEYWLCLDIQRLVAATAMAEDPRVRRALLKEICGLTAGYMVI